MLTITLSGPLTTELEARVALVESDFEVVDGYDHRLPDEPGVAYATALGEDIDRANECVRPYGWRLRMHSQPVKDATVMPAVALEPGTVRGEG
jgi:hypothetical protein